MLDASSFNDDELRTAIVETSDDLRVLKKEARNRFRQKPRTDSLCVTRDDVIAVVNRLGRVNAMQVRAIVGGSYQTVKSRLFSAASDNLIIWDGDVFVSLP